MATWNAWLKRKKTRDGSGASGADARKSQDTKIAVNSLFASNQRGFTGSRSDLCAGNLNNNQKLATLQMLRDFKDD